MKFLVFSCLLALAAAHDEYMGSCPNFDPMPGFDWDEFRAGRWYAMEKFDTSSKCFTYDFGEDEDGFRIVEQTRVLRGLKRFSIDNKYKYKGRIAAPSEAEPARMQVRFPLNVLGPASFVVMDTDYDSYALLCTCQQKDILFLTFHRRSCTILQREPIPDPTISKRLHDLLNERIGSPSDDEQPDHDFDPIDHTNCNYADDGKGLQIDVDKILGATKDETPFVLPPAEAPSFDDDEYGEYDPSEAVELINVDELAGGIFSDDVKEKEEGDIVNLPIKEKPRL